MDTCAGRRLAEWLQDEGHDAVRVTDGGADPGDAAILGRALAEARILITMDKDFGALVHRDRFALVRSLLDRFDEVDLTGAVVTVRGTRIRIQRPAN